MVVCGGCRAEAGLRLVVFDSLGKGLGCVPVSCAWRSPLSAAGVLGLFGEHGCVDRNT